MENPVNYWKPLRDNNAKTWLVTASVNAEKLLYWAISSQASGKPDEGSTSRSWSLSPYRYGGKDPRARGMLLPVFQIEIAQNRNTVKTL